MKSVAFLRGINLARNRRISMAELRDAIQALGYDDARTHLQSGNLVLTAASGSSALGTELSKAIEKQFGMAVAVYVRTRDELAAVVEANPLPDRVSDPSRFHVSFLGARPKKAAFDALDPAAYEPDAFAVHGREVYLHTPNGMSGTKLDKAFWKAVGDDSTTRNWRTVTRLLELASAG